MKLTLKEMIIYSFGNLGVAMVTVIHMLFLVGIFFPANEMRLPDLIPQGYVFLTITILGIILFGARIFDAFSDPFIANWSDRSKSKLGKRIPFMRRFAIPMGIAYVIVFMVPVTTGISDSNVLWLAGTMVISALFLTLYTVPYYSLMVDIAKTPEEKVDLGTYSSAFWFVGFILVSFCTSFWVPVEEAFNLSRLDSIIVVFSVVALVGVVFMLIPAFLLKESDYKSTEETTIVSFKDSIKTVARNKNYAAFFIGNTAYGTATYIFETGLLFYIVVLAMLNENVQGPLTTIIGVMTLLSYPLINKMSKKMGKKPVMLIGFLLFGLTFLVISIMGLWNINPYVNLVVMAILIPYSQAAFGILPTVITADCAAYDFNKTKEEKSAMYLAANGFSQKLGNSIATILFTSLLVFGKDVGDDMGIRYAVIAGAILSVIGVLAMLKYDEKEILSYADISVVEGE